MKKALVILAVGIFVLGCIGSAFGWSAIAVNQNDLSAKYGASSNAPTQAAAEKRALNACGKGCVILHSGADLGWWGIYFSKPIFGGREPKFEKSEVVFGYCYGKSSQNEAMGCAANKCRSLGGEKCGNSGHSGEETYGEGEKKKAKKSDINKNWSNMYCSENRQPGIYETRTNFSINGKNLKITNETQVTRSGYFDKSWHVDYSKAFTCSDLSKASYENEYHQIGYEVNLSGPSGGFSLCADTDSHLNEILDSLRDACGVTISRGRN
jgi:hypothetical protein